jgi:hypothetical protein
VPAPSRYAARTSASLPAVRSPSGPCWGVLKTDTRIESSANGVLDQDPYGSPVTVLESWRLEAGGVEHLMNASTYAHRPTRVDIYRLHQNARDLVSDSPSASRRASSTVHTPASMPTPASNSTKARSSAPASVLSRRPPARTGPGIAVFRRRAAAVLIPTGLPSLILTAAQALADAA